MLHYPHWYIVELCPPNTLLTTMTVGVLLVDEE